MGNDIPNENVHYTCIAWIKIDSVMKIDKKNNLQVYLEDCKYKLKKNANFWIHKHWTKSDSDSSDSELDSEKIGSKIDGKLIAKLESGSDSE